MAQIYRHNEPLVLESGEVIEGLEIAYDTFGKLNVGQGLA